MNFIKEDRSWVLICSIRYIFFIECGATTATTATPEWEVTKVVSMEEETQWKQMVEELDKLGQCFWRFPWLTVMGFGDW